MYASAFDLTWNKVLLSFDDLSLVDKFKDDNETYLVGNLIGQGLKGMPLVVISEVDNYSPHRKYMPC